MQGEALSAFLFSIYVNDFENELIKALLVVNDLTCTFTTRCYSACLSWIWIALSSKTNKEFCELLYLKDISLFMLMILFLCQTQ